MKLHITKEWLESRIDQEDGEVGAGFPLWCKLRFDRGDGACAECGAEKPDQCQYKGTPNGME